MHHDNKVNNKWYDWTIFGLGLWVIASPWIIKHVMATPSAPGGVTEIAMWNHYAVGLGVVIMAVVAAYAWRAWAEWANVVLGAWLLVSPWLLGFSGSADLMWNAVGAGAFIVLFAGWTLVEQWLST
jgi:hypothetical protein